MPSAPATDPLASSAPADHNGARPAVSPAIPVTPAVDPQGPHTHPSVPVSSASANSAAVLAQPVQPLLFWQLCTLCVIAGLLALHWPAPAIAAVALMIWADTALHPIQPQASPHTSRRATLRLLLALCCFGAAWCLGTGLLLPQPGLAPWATKQTGDKGAPRLRATIEKVQGLTDNRLRIILRDVTLDTDPSRPHSAPPPPLRGKAIWTWDSPPDTRPVEGETWTLRLPLYSTEGSNNLGLAQWGFVSRTQEHFWRVWNKGQRGAPQRVLHETGATGAAPAVSAASVTALWRESLRQRFFALFQSTNAAASQSPTPSVSSSPLATPAPDTHQTKPPAPDNSTTLALTQAQAIVPALLFGDRSALSTTTVDLFAKATLVHSLALSGQHLGVTVLLATLCVSLLAYCISGTFLRIPRRTLITLCALPLALLYLWLGNAPPSLQRAACMLVLLAFCLWRHRTMTTMDIICGALVCLVLLDPLSVFNLGLQLSALCVISIALVMPLVRACAVSPSTFKGHAPTSAPTPASVPALGTDAGTKIPLLLHPAFLRYHFQRIALHTGCGIARILCISCAIQVALLPINLLAFHTASIWFFLNVLWLPVLACVVLPCSVLALAATALHLPALAIWLANIATGPCDALLRLLHWMNAQNLLYEPSFIRPHWTSVLGYAALIVATALLWQRKGLPPASRRLALAGALLLFLGPVLRYAHDAQPAVEVSMLDVGQGQAVVLNMPHARRLLIDGGGSFSSRFDVGKALLAPALTYNSAPRAETLINTHPHIDHRKGLEYLKRHFQTHNWFDNTTLAAGDSLTLSDNPPLRLDVLHPPRNYQASSVNNASLIMRLVVGTGPNAQGLALFMGDAEAEAIATLLAAHTDLQAQVLVVAHHGSKTSYSPALYDAVHPRIALISHALQNRYGSPAPQVVQALEQRGITVYRTALHGQITVRWAIHKGTLDQPVTTQVVHGE